MFLKFNKTKEKDILYAWQHREFKRILIATIVVIFFFIFGTIGYYLLGYGEWSLIDCAYMTFITLSTIGYNEIFDLSNRPDVRIFTMILITFGLGAFAYYLSHLVSYIVEGDLRNFFWNKKMLKKTKKFKNHIIVCGAGRTGVNAIEELIAAKKQVIVIEKREEIIEYLQHEFTTETPVIYGDASDDDVLITAGIKEAYGLISTLPDDKDNIYTIISAKALNPNLKIITKSVDYRAVKKFYSVGANHVISSKKIGGVRMAIKMITPVAVDFMEEMLRHGNNRYRIDSLMISDKSKFIDKKLSEINIRKFSKALILAYKYNKKDEYNFLPIATTEFKAGMEVIILATDEDFVKLEEYFNN